MTQFEILELALIGAKVKLQNAARYFCTVSIGDKLYNNLKSAIQDYDEIMGLIEKKSEGVPAATDTPDEEHHSCES